MYAKRKRNQRRAQKLGLRLEIHLDQPDRTYFTQDRLTGTLQVTAESDTVFENITIQFCGIARTNLIRPVTALGTSNDSNATHEFLKLNQPDLAAQTIPGRILKAGQVYNFTFLFVIPGRLLPQACIHPDEHHGNDNAHLALPPSLDVKGLETANVLNDIRRQPANVHYCVLAQVKQLAEYDSGLALSVTARKAQHVRIVPIAKDEPYDSPNLHGGIATSCPYRQERKLRKGLLRSVLGTLVLEVASPPPLQILFSESAPSLSSINEHELHVSLRFEPTSQSQTLPLLDKITTKLQMHTSFTTIRIDGLDGKSDSLVDVHSGHWSKTMELGSHNVGETPWYPAPDSASIDSSGLSNSSGQVEKGSHGFPSYPGQRGVRVPGPSSTYRPGTLFHVINAAVPIRLSTENVSVPTFHSCLVSRTHSLLLSVSCKGVESGSAIELQIPVEVQAIRKAPTPCQDCLVPKIARNPITSIHSSSLSDLSDPCPGYYQ